MKYLFAILVFISLFLCITKKSSSYLTVNYADSVQKYQKRNIDSALFFANQGIENAISINECSSLAELNYLKAKTFDYYALWDSSFICYQAAAPVFVYLADSTNASKCFINIGVTHYYYGRYDSALLAYNLSSKYLESSKDTTLTSKVYNNLGLINKSLGNFTDAILNFQNVIDLLENTSNVLTFANAHFNIGLIYWEQNSYDEALKYYKYALDIYTQIDEHEDIANACNNIGLVYSKKKDTEQAILFYERAIELYSTIKNKNGLASALHNKAVLLDNAGIYDEAELLFLQALQIYEQNKYKLGSFICYCNLSKLYSVTGQKEKAIDYALRAVNVKDIDKPIKYIADSYLILANSYSFMNNYRLATDFYEKYIVIKDSLFSLKINEQISEIQTKYETEKKEIQLQSLNQQVEIQDLQIKSKQKRIVFITSILALMLISALIFIILYLQKRRSYLILVEQNVKLAKSDIEREKMIQSGEDDPLVSVTKYADTNLSHEQKAQLHHSLRVIIEKEKCFLDERLTINDLAKKINSNRNYLSQIINEHYQTNFNNFINEFRVKEARKLLINTDYQNYTIEGIAQTVGFNSKATFNAAFKKFTGVTPSFFRQNSNIL